MEQRTCSIDGCEGAVSARGWCGRHYQIWRKHEDPLWVPIRQKDKVCAVSGCARSAWARGWCSQHYQAWSKYGDPEGVAPDRPVRLCGFPGCERKHRAGGLCAAHLNQQRRGTDLYPIHPSRGSWKYTLDYGYFDDIDTPDKAYWLGFITADGCVHTDSGRWLLAIELKDIDADHLAVFIKCFNSNHPLHFSRGFVSVRISSKQIVESLARVGVGPRKSGVVEPWTGPDHLMRHYWRGMVDGDGTISPTAGRRKWLVNLVGSEACVRAFSAWAAPISESTASPRQVGPLCWSWAVAGTAKPSRLVRELYRNSTVALQRKADLADEILSMRYA